MASPEGPWRSFEGFEKCSLRIGTSHRRYFHSTIAHGDTCSHGPPRGLLRWPLRGPKADAERRSLAFPRRTDGNEDRRSSVTKIFNSRRHDDDDEFKAMGEMLGLLIDRPTLEKIGIDEQTPILVTADAEGLHLRPIRFATSEEDGAGRPRIDGNPFRNPHQAGPMNPRFLSGRGCHQNSGASTRESSRTRGDSRAEPSRIRRDATDGDLRRRVPPRRHFSDGGG